MKKTHKETETREVIVVDDIVCNICGKSITTVPENQWLNAPLSAMESITVCKTWGFNSRKDMITQYADFCEPCWDKLCDTFAVPVQCAGYGDLPEEEDPQLSLFTYDEMSGIPELIDSGTCGFIPPTPGYAPCTRSAGHVGPCAHPLKDS